jgi:hypothetical protein
MEETWSPNQQISQLQVAFLNIIAPLTMLPAYRYATLSNQGLTPSSQQRKTHVYAAY